MARFILRLLARLAGRPPAPLAAPAGRPSGRWVLALLLMPAALLAPAVRAADCPPAAAPLTEAQVRDGLRDARDRGLLWRLEKGGRVSWLYGTIHVARQAWMFPGPKLLAALRESDRLALELDLMDPAVVNRLQQALRQPADAVPLPPALQARLEAAARSACLGNALQALRPEVQVAMLSALALRGDGLDPAWGVDGFLAGFGRGLGRAVVSLETPEDQAALLSATDAGEAVRGVTQALDQLEQGAARRQMLQLADLWATGDHDRLARYAEWCDCMNTETDRAQMRRMLDDRNRPMADQIARQHEGGLRVFAAVGALHMIGPQGLPALLQARGFTVQRVALSAADAPAPR